MKAARWHSAKDIRIDDTIEPDVTPGTVKVKVAWCGICESDLREYRRGPVLIPSDPHIITMGHEFSGEIVDIGAGVVGLAIGDRVAVEPILSCRTCPACREGRYNLCDRLGVIGLTGDGGGFAPYAVVSAKMVHKLPDALSLQQGALVEPATIALLAVRVSLFKPGVSAAVFGAGPTGLCMIDALRAEGAGEIYMVDASETRRAKARGRGATCALHPSDAVAQIRAATGGGVQLTFALTGTTRIIQQSAQVLAKGGQSVFVSIKGDHAPLPAYSTVLSERSLRGAMAYRNIYRSVMDLMREGYFGAENLVTRQIKLDDIVADGFEPLLTDPDQLKILVNPAA